VPETPFLITTVSVSAARRISPSFVRIELAAPELQDLGGDGPFYDQRIKLIFPGEAGALPAIDPDADNWYTSWLALPEAERGTMRTYSIRDLRGDGADRRLVIDFVLHLTPGAAGPASAWASQARPGDRLVVIGPRRGTIAAGIEFEPGDAERLLLCGDETAMPAIARILGDLPARARGTVLLEVPDAGDVTEFDRPDGVEVVWLPRDGGTVGTRLIPTAIAHLSGRADGEVEASRERPDTGDEIWETPGYSGAGEPLDSTAPGIPGLYAWVAGESGVVTTIRRHLVRELGCDRKQVAFMGYWRHGVAMRG